MKKKMILITSLLLCNIIIFSGLAESLPSSAGLPETYLENTYELFSENGSYSTWSFQTKLKWINLMPSSNQKLFHSEHDLDEYVAQRYGKGNIQTVSLHYVLEEMWGNHFFWTLEQQALVWNWTEKYFPNEQWDVQMNFIPDKSVVPLEDAIQIAWKAVSDVEGLPMSITETDFVTGVSYGISRIYAADYPPYYTIYFGIPLDEEDDQREPVTVYYSCNVSNFGEVMDSSYFPETKAPKEEKGIESPFEPLPYFETFGSWSIEEKAAFSKEWYSYMKEYKKIHPGYRGMYYYETCHAYGLPTDQDIGQDRAEKISRDALKRYGVSDDYINRASTHFYFDISNPEHKLWKVYLSTLFAAEVKYEDALGYFVTIASATGEVENVEVYEIGKALENFR